MATLKNPTDFQKKSSVFGTLNIYPSFKGLNINFKP